MPDQQYAVAVVVEIVVGLALRYLSGSPISIECARAVLTERRLANELEHDRPSSRNHAVDA
jgi:hypothetical protein